jgi:hypothetical protein
MSLVSAPIRAFQSHSRSVGIGVVDFRLPLVFYSKMIRGDIYNRLSEGDRAAVEAYNSRL